MAKLLRRWLFNWALSYISKRGWIAHPGGGGARTDWSLHTSDAKIEWDGPCYIANFQTEYEVVDEA